MTTSAIMKWYRDNLAAIVEKAIAFHKVKNPSLIYTTDWIVAMAFRETWTIANKYVPQGITFENILPLIKGDYSQRAGELEKQYHGFGFWQIDLGSYPEFIKSGAWKDPYKCCVKAIDVLEEKRKYLEKTLPEVTPQMITSAYNCGQGNVAKAVRAGKSCDHYTHGKDYSKMVWEYRNIYNNLNKPTT